jgi:poly(3-hydroxybutyrate) depolymerase
MLRTLVVAALAALVACGNAHPAGAVDALAGSDAPRRADATDGSTCGTRVGMRDLTSRTLRVAGLARAYLVYLPASDDPTQPMPLVFVHHGWAMSAQEMVDVTGYRQLADSEHVALAFPEGQAGPNSTGAPWNVGANVCSTTAGAPPIATGDDFAFLDAMKADIAHDQCLDLAHVYVTGFSMGGYFSHHAGCMRGDVRAVAPHSGGTHALDDCPVEHKPIIIFHGTADPVIPDGCDDPAGFTPEASPPRRPRGRTGTAARLPPTRWASRTGRAPSTTGVLPMVRSSCARSRRWAIAGQGGRPACSGARPMRARPSSSGDSSASTRGDGSSRAGAVGCR